MSANDTKNGSINEPLDTSSNLALHMTLAALTGIAWYNVVELNLAVYLTFRRRRGLYFWSVLACIQGIAVHSSAFILKLYGVVTTYQVTVTLITVGWYLMVTGQALVLYSRLHLVVGDRPRLVRAVLVMILCNAVAMHIPTTVLTYGSNATATVSGAKGSNAFTRGFVVMERIQMTVFSLQELAISGIYIWATLRFLRRSGSVAAYGRRHVRSVMVQLLWINVAIIVMDLAMLTVEYMGLYFLGAVIKGAIYSVKLKLEFAVLNQLMRIASASSSSSSSSSREHVETTYLGDSKGHSIMIGGGSGPRGKRQPLGVKSWLRHLLPSGSTHLYSNNGSVGAAQISSTNTYYIHPSELQSTPSTRHHQQERNVSCPPMDIGSESDDEATPRHPSHGIAMTTEIYQEVCTAAELDQIRAEQQKQQQQSDLRVRGKSDEDDDDNDAASDRTSISQLELIYLPSPSLSSSYNTKLPIPESPRPTAQLPWTATRSHVPPTEPQPHTQMPLPSEEPVPRGMQQYRPSVANLRGGMDAESRTSSETQMRLV